MSRYTVNRELLEAYSTGEILRILKKEREDYTPEAIEIFQEILAERGVHLEGASQSLPEQAQASPLRQGKSSSLSSRGNALTIRTPSDARQVLNDILRGLLEGTVTPETAQAANSVIMGILRAIDQEYMEEPEEEPQ